MNLNDKYIFISDGTWFDEGTEVTIEDNCLFSYKERKSFSEVDISAGWGRYEGDFMKINKYDWMGLFRGKRGDNEDDGEMCGLDEFEIKER